MPQNGVTLGGSPLQEPAGPDGDDSALQVKLIRPTQHVSDTEIGLTRRWLWEQFNVVEVRRPPAPALVRNLWNSDPIACAKSLRRALSLLILSGKCQKPDALTWGRAASLEGRKMPRAEIDSRLGLSTRAVDNHLRVVDRALATFGTRYGFPVVDPVEAVEPVVLGLVESVLARGAGFDDEADGLYLAAAGLADVPTNALLKPIGRNRTTRSRTRRTASLRLQLAPSAEIHALVMEQSAKPGLVIARAELQDDPDLALDTLERSWRSGDLPSLPLVLRRAMDLVPSASVGGLVRWLRLLELGSNVFRDAESLTALAWTSAWIGEVRSDDAVSMRAEINGRKTRAHVLQLHGFARAAARELDQALKAFHLLRPEEIGDYEVLYEDLLIRRAAVDAVMKDVATGRSRLLPIVASGNASPLRLPAFRQMLHMESVYTSEQLQRRVFAGRRSRSYEAALMQLIGELSDPTGVDLAALDSIIHSAIRVGDLETIRSAVESVDWPTVRGAPNLTYRLSERLKVAARLPGLKDVADISIPGVEHPLRMAGLVPRNIDFLL